MTKILPLPSAKLHARLEPSRVPYKTSDTIPRRSKLIATQPRAFQALELGLNIKAHGFNIYICGETELGRTYLLRDYLLPRAKKEQVPPDFVYVYNFEDHDSPKLISLPAGQGSKLKNALAAILPRIKKEIQLRLDRNSYIKRRTSLVGSFQNQRDSLLRQMNKMAETQGFNLGADDQGGMTLYPLIEGKRLNEQEYENLEEGLRSVLKKKGDSLMEPMSGFLRKLAKAEQKFIDAERSLEKDLVSDVLAVTLDPLAEKFLAACANDNLRAFFADLREDTLENLDALMPQDYAMPASPSRQGGLSPLGELSLPPVDGLQARYTVNVFVDNAKTSGAPIIFENHPTLSNLMGCIERESEMGALITDFTLIKAGAIHKALGGYLILRVEDLLHHSRAWDALLRSIRIGFSRIEDSGEDDTSKTKGIQPEAIPLDLKVILIGKEEIFDMLIYGDERFGKIFKIKAHLAESMPRNNSGIRTYLSHLKRVIDEDSLLPFDQAAMAGLVDFGSRLIEDQQRLSLRFTRVRELMVEASALAASKGEKLITREILQRAEDSRNFRSNMVEEEYLEEYDRRIIKVLTDGEGVGKVNGLAVSFYGDFEFGLPHLISCTVGAGSGGIIDLERDAQLGGPIHTKAMMILKSYLVRSFAHDKPLVLTGSLGLEQNYAGIEGDSASGAELVALLSALAGYPVRLDFAFTGAVGQSGEIMAVGGVSKKIEGFFKVCKRHGLTGKQGVLIPKDNVPHVLLRDELLEAIDKKQFHVYAVDHITQAVELLTGLPAGKLRKDGTYTKGSLFYLVDQRLRNLAAMAERIPKRRIISHG